MGEERISVKRGTDRERENVRVREDRSRHTGKYTKRRMEH